MTVTKSATLAFVSLGCPKNLVDSERMLGKLAQDGYALTPDADGADVVVVNTCGFIEPARQESLGVIREMLALKEQGRVGAVVVAGCLAERKQDDLLQEVPGVDHIVGVFGREEIAQVVDRTLRQRRQDEQRSLFRPAPVSALEDTARLRITPRHYAYLKISEGCDRLCTFCAIPGMRGKHVTKPIEEVLREARELAADGVRELILVAQDTTYYGLDLYGRVRLAELLRELDQVDGIEWIRILYAYPIHFTDELIDTLADVEEDRAVSRHAAAAHQRPDAASACSGASTGRRRRICSAGCAGASRAWRCGRRSSSAFPARPRRSSRSCAISCRQRASSASASFPTRSSRARRPTRLTDHLPEEVKQRAARPADGDAAGGRLRLDAGSRSARSWK